MTEGQPERVVSQFGAIGTEVARHAGELVELLSEDLVWSPGDSLEWEQADRLALIQWLELDSGVALIAIPEELTGEASQSLADAVLGVRVALPFNEAERGWLHKIPSPIRQPMPIWKSFEHADGKIMSAGVRRSVSGHDLMSRWLAWRRQTDEYAGQASLEAACEALHGLRTVLLTSHSPYEYGD